MSSSVLSISGSAAERWDPVVAEIHLDAGDLMISFEAGTNRFLIYDGNRLVDDRWSGFFEERSSVVVDGSNLLVTVLPNGGWWTTAFTLRFYSGTELTT